MPSIRSEVVRKSRYSRPLPSGGFESWLQTVNRVIEHQRWLWERAAGRRLKPHELVELAELRDLHLRHAACLAGRSLWLGGTEISKTRESSQFNCWHGCVRTVHDAVDNFWLLLQGCGTGFTVVPGILNGFPTYIPNIEVVRSKRTDRGVDFNQESFNGTDWHLTVGDSAEAWAKALGKLLASKHYGCKRLILDFSQVRPKGTVLKGYGWVSSGDELISKAFVEIARILNTRADQLLRKEDGQDIVNLLGSVLSSRRSAQIAHHNFGEDGWREFAAFKTDHWDYDLDWRSQSNNSLVFWSNPSPADLHEWWLAMVAAGGSEPGIINGVEARRRAPWFQGVNPCCEILLPDGGFCNLCDINVGAFETTADLSRALWIMGRANYRQTCVNLKDGILQDRAHESNSFLRLCGVGLTGLLLRPQWLHPRHLETFRASARAGSFSMADELRLPRSKAVTTVKPSGTLSKLMDCTEGMHRPLSPYLLNNIQFSVSDPTVAVLRAANYAVHAHPSDPTSCLVSLPVRYPESLFQNDPGSAVDSESAISQLERYKLLNTYYADHNVSSTIYYTPSESQDILNWLHSNWSSVIGLSFLPRYPVPVVTDVRVLAQPDPAYPYLPQQPVTKSVLDTYESLLLPVDLSSFGETTASIESCASGACPSR